MRKVYMLQVVQTHLELSRKQVLQENETCGFVQKNSFLDIAILIRESAFAKAVK
jgi:hypothetical protein